MHGICSLQVNRVYDRSECRFAESVIKAAKGAKGIVEPSFVYLPGIAGGDVVRKSVQGLDFFSANLELGVKTF